MPRLRISMRWWLAGAFAAIAAFTAVFVAEFVSDRAERAFQGHAVDIATGSAVAVARRVAEAFERGDAERTSEVLATGRRMSVFTFDRSGRQLTDAQYQSVRFGDRPRDAEALREALAGRRYVATADGGRAIVVALPLRFGVPGGALVAVALRQELVAEASLIHDEIVMATVWAILAAVVTGLLVASLIAARLRRIASAATAIQAGRFDTELRSTFGDEVGDLARAIDGMRGHLRASMEALASERDRLRMLFEQLHEGVIAVDKELEVVLVNPTAKQLVGPILAEGRPLAEPWADLSLRRIAARLFGAESSVLQARVSPDEDTTIAVAGVPAGPASHLALLVLADVSAQERRERAEREFVANAAHELRTPISAIASAVEALSAGAIEDAADRQRFLAIVDRNTSRLARLIRALLALARAQTREEPLRLEPVALAPVLEDVAAGLEVNEGVAMRVACPATLVALAQPDILGQVVGNLAANSAKHVVEGSIVLAARRVDGDRVAIEVSDTGPGLTRGERERMFDRFYTGMAQREGLGLGLAIVREAVRALGGIVEVDSVVGAGTTVRVILAAKEEVAA